MSRLNDQPCPADTDGDGGCGRVSCPWCIQAMALVTARSLISKMALGMAFDAEHYGDPALVIYANAEGCSIVRLNEPEHDLLQGCLKIHGDEAVEHVDC